MEYINCNTCNYDMIKIFLTTKEKVFLLYENLYKNCEEVKYQKMYLNMMLQKAVVAYIYII